MQPRGNGPTTASAENTALLIMDCFAAYHADFDAITRRAKQRFERRAWLGLYEDAQQRLDQYKDYVNSSVKTLDKTGTAALTTDYWVRVKAAYAHLIEGRADFDIAESFYNSVTMRLLPTTGLDPSVHFSGSEFDGHRPDTVEPVYKAYAEGDSTRALVRKVLEDCRFAVPFQSIENSVVLVAGRIEAAVLSSGTPGKITSLEVVDAVFYRGKGAYRVGRICTTTGYLPLAIALSNNEEGIYVDAVLLSEDEVSIIFSFARWYFHVEANNPYALVRFLKSIMPLKPLAELYISLGYNKHGKTERYRDLMRHLERSADKFEIAPGARGMVMVVFTLPSYDLVFKIIKDRFDPPKTTTRQEVRDRYQLVFKHDRGGRLVDAQEFEHLRFAKDRFSEPLLAELLEVASRTVTVSGEQVVIEHLYTERRLIPLDIYLREAASADAARAVVDYGQAIKDLAATNIFPGDILLKNFGVTRHGRVVFYDYDELCLLTDCNFREMPQSEDEEDDMFAEPWFSVGEQDVFPEELRTWLGMGPPLSDIFTEHYAELFGVKFWLDLQKRHNGGDVIEVLPYSEQKRFPHSGNASAEGML